MSIHPQNSEIEQIYQNIWNLGFASVVFTSPNAGEGVSTVAQTVAQRFLLAGHRTLLVDLNLYRPTLQKLLPIEREDPRGPQLLHAPTLVAQKDEQKPILGITAPTDRNAILKLRKPGTLKAYINEWQQEFDLIIFDATPVNRINSQNIPADTIAAACDACYLVVETGKTLQSMVVEASNRLKKAGANVAGCILNDMHNPSLKSELLRQCRRIKPFSEVLYNFLRRWIYNNQYLCIDD